MILALIVSRNVPDEAMPVLDRYKAVCLGDGTKFERLYKSRSEAIGVPCLVFRPYFKVDSRAVFDPRHFFAANRQKIWNADEVLIIRTADDETVAAQEYAEKLGKKVTVVHL